MVKNLLPTMLSVWGLSLLLAPTQTHAAPPSLSPAAQRLQRYDVVWTTPSRDASGAMPVGNGDLAASVYALQDGDLYLLLANNDAYTYLGDLYKTARVRISLQPNPFTAGGAFTQRLDLATGSIQLEANGVSLRVWVDANRPVFHVEINSPRELAVRAKPEFWKRYDHLPYNETGGYSPAGTEPPQDVRLERPGQLLWYFAVGNRSIYPDDLKYYQVEQMTSVFPDPFRYNTFGNLLEGPGLSLADGALAGRGRSFDIRIHALTLQMPDPGKWTEAIQRLAARPLDARQDWERHCRWWAEFWDRGWITASDNTVPAALREQFYGEPDARGRRREEDSGALAAQNYNVFRFLMACQSRGRVQAKFNGGLFTQQLRLAAPGQHRRLALTQQPDGSWLTHEDDRLWGRRFTYQNQRLLYWPLLASGDFELMRPFFDYYSSLLPVRKAITQAWFGHEGAYYRENIEPTGAERDCGKEGRPPRTKPGEPHEGWYHDYYFTSGLETLAMMIDYANFTGQKAFRDQTLLPFAREVLLFFDKHYGRGPDGKLRLEPAQVIETWWVALNPAPDLAGLRFCLDELLTMKAGTAQDQARWRRFRAEIPPVPLRLVDGHQAIAPAEKWDKMKNAENGELYPVFPFRCFGVAQGSADLVGWTMNHRSVKDAFGSSCWTQDQIHWAFAGNAAAAADGLARRFRTASTMCRFPLFGREEPDSCPDFDHFGAGAVALQRMLVQEADGKIVLLPAWPAAWDVDFKLHVSHGGVVTGTVKAGQLITWNIQPSARKSQVVVGQLTPQKKPAAP